MSDRIALQLLVGAFGDQLAAVLAGARTEVENAVASAHDIRIVLDDQDGVAEVAQILEYLDEAVCVAGMQSDGRLVQHVEGADQPRPERRGQLDALRLAAGKGRGQAVERQVLQADLD